MRLIFASVDRMITPGAGWSWLFWLLLAWVSWHGWRSCAGVGVLVLIVVLLVVGPDLGAYVQAFGRCGCSVGCGLRPGCVLVGRWCGWLGVVGVAWWQVQGVGIK